MELLSICRDVIGADNAEAFVRRIEYVGFDRDQYQKRARCLSEALKAKRDAVVTLAELHATTWEGLLQKARAALAAKNCIMTASMEVELLRSLAVDLIHLVPTLIDTNGRSIVAFGDDAEGVS
ncbi:hypothetical protein HN018_24525 (plasmid) [Lichenicola cladoniae]|uniref:Uncharacterized protein n=1 Tax=Lichenicola cladoniae TaxID=1484109 RepID=A0A6M8HXT1_9PROT|nr:hypothetical protein [Lichenicola cladoniae]NPD69006.1 hypothetical protein [Acetobacteraceae bacterium]QKE93364.1 hypothetical protein HN018_24525 [Lichenicola cladoniae]